MAGDARQAAGEEQDLQEAGGERRGDGDSKPRPAEESSGLK